MKFLLCICFYSGVKDEVCVISGHWIYFIIIFFLDSPLSIGVKLINL